MTTLAQIKKLTAPLMQRNADLTLVKDMLVVTPVHHILRYILIGRTSNADRFNPCWGAYDLFHQTKHLGIGAARDIRSSQGPWKFSNTAATAAFVEAVEESVLPKLRKIHTLSAFLRSRARKLARHPQTHISERFLASLVSGKLDQARNILSESKGAWHLNDLNQRKPGLGDRLRDHGDLLESDDRRELATMLHAFEAYTVKNLGLEKVWEKTPFPLEKRERL